ncbi:MAG TPA: hypothetical protein VM935_18835, partial [Chitinophagaceae bacterium]|nr:hypothetical protein [Chitinophagaceae bacterium]
MIKYIKIFCLLFVVAITCEATAQSTPEALGWKLGAQVYSFRMFSFEEALNKADSIGIKFIQGFPGQKIGA